MPTKTQRPTIDAAARERWLRSQFIIRLQGFINDGSIGHLLCLHRKEELTILLRIACEEKFFEVAAEIKYEMTRRRYARLAIIRTHQVPRAERQIARYHYGLSPA